MDAPTIRSICCIGAGYVGGPTMAVVADRCPHIQVTVVDLNEERIGAWNSADLSLLPIYEPGLDEVVGRARGRNLHFTTSVEGAIATADMVFISVNTPTKTHGVGAGQASDLKWIEASARMLAKAATGHTIVVEKSTLPVRTAQAVKSILEAGPAGKSFAVLSNPEFLAEGSAIRDLENPDRVLIGGESQEAIEALAGIYGHWVAPEKILRTNLWSSELSKLTANAFLAQRISSINSIAALCEATGADVREVANAIGADSRIGPKFLTAGPGFGGSCFQKDILNLVYLCRYYGLEDVASYWEQVVTLNTWQQHRISRLMVNRLFGTISGKRIAVLGFAFKADTNDTRESPAIQVCLDLLEEGACLAIVDPKVREGQISIDLGKPAGQGEGNWQLVDSVEAAAEGADALVLLTEWQQFAQINWPAVAALMRQPAWLFDSRAKADGAAARAAGLNVWTLGEG
ncbi:MAG: UDPglucose 6-dehydrogenase [Cyanobium sp.]|jgi:UDPglucose 6-dehydrogenase|uniref:nucleotide sugar dehydrogenase n=1 Tax=Synechococcus sp. CS-1331 TaxID=2847973 RepID=UPI00223C51CC|nr:nucleotide sugar dehydrogenase [Synechococcus sp. CS-1331]MCT0228068.1 nucleotide sugar dehydrogenase [Synechococcus sp. CS-1331]